MEFFATALIESPACHSDDILAWAGVKVRILLIKGVTSVLNKKIVLSAGNFGKSCPFEYLIKASRNAVSF